jgi:hypothetical protein
MNNLERIPSGSKTSVVKKGLAQLEDPAVRHGAGAGFFRSAGQFTIIVSGWGMIHHCRPDPVK